MAQIRTSTDRSRFPSQPRARGNNFVSARDIAAGSPDVGQLGDALQRAGDVGMRIATDIEYKQSEAQARAAQSEYREMFTQQKQAIRSRRGSAALSARKDIEEAQRVLGENAAKSLATPLAKDMFERWRMDFDSHERSDIDAFVLQQADAWRLETIDGNLQDHLDDTTGNPADGQRFAGNIQKGKADIAEKFYGHPANVVAREQRKYALSQITARAAALANDQNHGPAAALEFLESGVDVEIGDDKTMTAYVNELRKKYESAAVNNDINVMAMDLADQTDKGFITSAEVQRLAYEKYPDDPTKPQNAKLRETMMNVYDNHISRLKSGRQMQATQAKQELTDKLSAADFNLDAMSPDDQKAILMDPELYRSVSRFQKWKTNEANPDYHWIYQMEQMEPDKLKEWLNEPRSEHDEYSNFDIFLRKTAGKHDLMNRIYSRTKSGSGGTSESARFNPGGFFEDIYRDLYKITGILWDSPENFLDADANTAKSRRNGFLLFYENALADKERELGRKANFAEQRDVAVELARMIRESNIDLDKSFWSQMPGDAEQASEQEVKIDIDAIPFERRRINRGENVVLLSPAIGAPRQEFGDISPDDKRQLPPSIIDLKANRVLRAYASGAIAGQDYAADDLIVYGRRDEIIIFGADGEIKGDPMMKVLPPHKEEEARAREEAEALARGAEVHEAEGELNRLRNRKIELINNYNNTFGNRLADEANRRKLGELIPRNNQGEMARLHHDKRMKEIDAQIKQAEQELQRISGGTR